MGSGHVRVLLGSALGSKNAEMSMNVRLNAHPSKSHAHAALAGCDQGAFLGASIDAA